MSHRFQDRVVVITGASAGIGAACARRFADEGARLLLVARGKAELERTAAGLNGRAIVHAADVADPEAQAGIIDRAVRDLGGLNVLVNNAGFNRRGAFGDFPAEDFGRIVDVNLRAPITLTRLALPHLLASRHGAVVNVASLAGRVPLAHEAVYSATKFGLRTFSMALSDELRGTGVTVSAVSPGPVDTNFIMADVDEVPDIVLSQPLSTADEIAALVLDCAADGRPERMAPRLGGHLATLGYLAPPLRRLLRPVMEWRGRRNKAKYKSRAPST
jgi:short-subunit dehydrogenase